MQVVRETLREVLPRMHGRVLRDVRLRPALGCTELVVPREFVRVADAFVSEERAAVGKVLIGAGTVLDKDVLVVVAHLMTEVAEHRAVGLTKPNPQRLPVVVKRFDEVDGDDASCVPDDHPLILAIARQQVEGQAAVPTP